MVFFSSAAGEIVAIAESVSGGGGAFRPKKKKASPDDRGHVLVVGGGVSAPNKASVECFLKMLCRDAAATPAVVLLGDVISDSVKAMCAESWAARGNGVQFFAGSALKKADLDRVKVFVPHWGGAGSSPRLCRGV